MVVKPISFLKALAVSLLGMFTALVCYVVINKASGGLFQTYSVYDKWALITGAMLGSLLPDLFHMISACIHTKTAPTILVTTAIAIGVLAGVTKVCYDSLLTNSVITIATMVHIPICIPCVSWCTSYVSMQYSYWQYIQAFGYPEE